ncbi:MAG: hypothetical protein AAGN15_04930 [Cyanobacteria bacterium J06581_3]
MFSKLKSKLNPFNKLFDRIEKLETSINLVKESLGRIECRQLQKLAAPRKIADMEFKVFSQWGEDGIIQYLIREVCPSSNIFIEFGVENYRESNTRFLLVNNNWAGLVVDGSISHIADIKRQAIYWQRNLKAVHHFITAENINNIFEMNGISGEVGLLSIDVDGNDYWVWKSINSVRPAIVVCEYNFRFGPNRAVTIPYDPGFVRSKAHHSTIYYGASLRALNILAEQKGYILVGCNSAGNNAFFVRKDLKPNTLREVSVDEGFVQGKYRETRNENGELTYLSCSEELDILKKLPLIEVE